MSTRALNRHRNCIWQPSLNWQTYVAGSTASLGVDADDSVSDNAVDIVTVLVAHDGHADEVQELEAERSHDIVNGTIKDST